jgi:hypothetical protein
MDTCPGKEDCSFEGTEWEGTSSHLALPSLSHSKKKKSVPDVIDITEDFTDYKTEILNELFDTAIHCFLISHGKYYILIELVAIHP